MIVFAFDRDLTVDVNQGPVPLSLVRHLAHETDHEVWATGNQLLKAEAGIPGIEEMRERNGMGPGKAGREKRLHILRQIFPDVAARIVVDDVDLSHVEGWLWFSPETFMELVGTIQLGPLAPQHGGRVGEI